MQIAGKHQTAGVRREITSKRQSQSIGQVQRKINDAHLIWRTGAYHGIPAAGYTLTQDQDKLTVGGWEAGKRQE